MDLFQLEAFVTVVREGSFSKAAKALFRTQPAVSQIIQRLEDEIGQPLFDRSSRRGVLTDAGQVLLEHAERLMNFKGQALAALDDVRHLRSGQLVIAAQRADVPVSAAAAARLSPALSRGAAVVRRALASRIPADVRDYGADLGVVTYQPGDAELESVVVYRDELAFVVPRDASVHETAASGDQGSRRGAFRRAPRDVAVPRQGGRDVSQAPRHAADAGRDADDRRDQEVRGRRQRRGAAAGDRGRGRARRAASWCACACRSWRSSGRCAWSIARAGSVSHAAAAFLTVAEAHAARRRGRYAFTRE